MSKNRQGLQLKILLRKKRSKISDKTTEEKVNPTITELNNIASHLMTSYDETMKTVEHTEPTFYCSNREELEQDEEYYIDDEDYQAKEINTKWTGLLLLDEHSLLDIFSSLNISTHGPNSFSTVYDKVYEIGCDTTNSYWNLLNSLNTLLDNENSALHLKNLLSNQDLVESLTRLFQNKSQA